MLNRRPSCRRIAGALTRPAGILVVAELFLAGCGSDSLTDMNGTTGRTFTVAPGQEVDIRLQSIGPGEYQAPPAISSTAIRFQSAGLVGPSVPAGVTQLFRFQALRQGRAIVTFRHSGQTVTVVDTVDVE
jgi:hypothetical protein